MLFAAAACAGPEPAPVAVPVFVPSPITGAEALSGLARSGSCEAVLPPGEVEALLALPIDSITLRETRYPPEPEIGRDARIRCQYSRAGSAGQGGAGQGGLLQLSTTLARYRDADAATQQWRLNTDAQRRGRPSQDTQLGTAPAVFVEHPDGQELIVNGEGVTVTITVFDTTAQVPGRGPGRCSPTSPSGSWPASHPHRFSHPHLFRGSDMSSDMSSDVSSEPEWHADKQAFLDQQGGHDALATHPSPDSELRRRRGEFGPLAAQFAHLASRLFSAGTAADVLDTILDAAAGLFPEADLVSITLRTGDSGLETPAATHELAAKIDALQQIYAEGPCIDATSMDGAGVGGAADAGGASVVADHDLSVSSRWPRFGPAAAALGVRSVVSFGLLPAAPVPRLGALTFYAYEPHILTAFDRDIGLLLAAHAGAALAAARSVEAADLRVANLERALLSRDVIGQAKGMLMAQRGITAAEAFDILRATSQRLNVKLSQIAQAVADRRIEL
ncbi:ANTAR domain-containing protein [Pseudonocardia sp. RS010]|uniref:ANTAR domain-containing protein n=1 Tax=Pseudonocardia sp. RS010 TaxID=3385979 RepID=UPI00399FB13A